MRTKRLTFPSSPLSKQVQSSEKQSLAMIRDIA